MSGTSTTAPRRHIPHRLKVSLIQLFSLAAFFGIWAYYTGPGGVSPLFIASIPATASALWDIILDPNTWAATWTTVFQIIVALAIALVVGFGVGFYGSRSQLRLETIEPLVAWGYMVPFVLFYPVLLLWLGVDEMSKIAYGAANGLFPMALNTMKGFKSVDKSLVRTARAFGASERQIEWTVKLPSALPVVLTGVRVGAALTVITVILAEMLASRRGLGFELSRASQTLQVPRSYGYIIFIIAIVSVLHFIIQKIDVRR